VLNQDINSLPGIHAQSGALYRGAEKITEKIQLRAARISIH